MKEYSAENLEKLKMVIQVIVYGFSGQTVYIDLCDTEEELQKMVGLQLMVKIQKKMMPNAPLYKFGLCYGAHRLRYSALLCECGITHMSIIHVIFDLSGGGGSQEEWKRYWKERKDAMRISMERLSDFQKADVTLSSDEE